MKKYCIFILAIFLVCTSCTSIQMGNSSSSQKETTTSKSSKNDGWDIAMLDTARDVPYLSKIEKDVILETNKARTNPAKYAEMYIEPRIKRFNGKKYNNYIITNEGAVAVKECVNVMKKQKALSVLSPSEALSKASDYHASMQALTNQVGHTSPDGSTMVDRITKYGNFMGYGENISYGEKSGQDIVVSLLIDDGVPNRGHRTNILNKDFEVIGCAYENKHKVYNSVCVINYAYGEQ